MNRVPDAPSLGLRFELFPKNPTADPDKTDLRVRLQHGGRGCEQVVVTLALEEPGDGGERDLVILQAQLLTNFRARSRRVQERIDIHAAVNRGELLRTTHPRGQSLFGHGVADAHDRMTPPRGPFFQGDIKSVLPG